MSEKPKVVYWSNQPSPYTVGRLNAVHDLGEVELCAWFDQVKQADRSWDVEPADWRFPYRWVPELGPKGRGWHIPVRLLKETKPDLIAQLFDQPPAAVGALVSRAYAGRVTFRVLPAFQAWGQDTAFTRMAKRFLFRVIDGAKVPGPTGRRRAVGLGLPAERCLEVAQTIDVDLYAGADLDRAETRQKMRADLRLTGLTFIYVGRLVKAKGLDYLIQAFRKLRAERSDVHLLLVGDGADEGHYRALSAGISDVQFIGFVQPADLPAYYVASDVLVFPTLGDPHGLVVEEAMAAGLAVITSDAAGDIEQRVIGRDAGQVVEAASVPALLAAMQAMSDQPGETRATGDRNRKAVAGLTHDAYAVDFGAFVREILAKPARSTFSAHVASVLGHVIGATLAMRGTNVD